MFRSSAEIRRRANEHQSVQEGITIWQKHKKDMEKQKFKDQRQLREMLEKYNPWGRPGGGAPNNSIRIRNVTLDEIYPQEDYKKLNPLRLGRPGGGAPRITPSGKSTIAHIHEDPALRFQWHKDMRKVVDNDLRYRVDRFEQQKYRKQLDTIVAERRRNREREMKDKLEYEKNMGWSTEGTLKKLEKERILKERMKRESDLYQRDFYNQLPEKLTKIPEEINGNNNKNENLDKENVKQISQHSASKITSGVVSLLAKRRDVKLPLTSTDVTRETDSQNWRNVDSGYLKELSKQVTNKYQKLKELRVEDAESSKRHFDTWRSFWGRPGHGAPCGMHQKKSLYALLYQLPVH